MDKRKFKYDSRLRPEDLRFFEDLVGKSISNFRLENASISLPPHFTVENQGRCWISFYSKGGRQSAIIEMTSLFTETPPVVDSGGIFIRKIYESRIPTRAMLHLNLKREWHCATNLGYSEDAPVTSFRFYGSMERRSLREIDPDMNLEYLKSLGYNDYPDLEVDTIEFMLIEHANHKKTIISTQSGGFWYNFLTDAPIDDKMLFDSLCESEWI